MPRIIGIAGKKRSGKDTAADIIDEYSNNKVKTFAFATILKEVVQKVFIISDEQMIDLKEVKIERLGYSPRQLLQNSGDHFRKVNPNVFTDYMEHNISSHTESDITIIITDVRFDDECMFIKKHNGVLIGIDAEERLRARRARDGGAADNHCTEKGVSKDLVDFWVTNNGTKEQFKDKMIKLIKDIL